MAPARLIAVCAALFLANAAFAQVPHTFAPGTPAKASDVNENFAALSNQIAGKVSASQALGNGQPPVVTGNFTFWAPTAQVAITSTSQKVLVLSMKVVGCSGPGNSGYWSVNICYRPVGSAGMGFAIASPTNPSPDWTPYFIIPAGMLFPVSLSAILPSLPPGNYEVGLCGAPVGAPPPAVNTLQWYAGDGNGYTQVVQVN